MKASLNQTKVSSQAVREIINNEKKKCADLLRVIDTLKEQLKSTQEENDKLRF